jgi:hypothetical protein
VSSQKELSIKESSITSRIRPIDPFFEPTSEPMSLESSSLKYRQEQSEAYATQARVIADPEEEPGF